MSLSNPKAFFDRVRKDGLLGRSLDQQEVEGLNTILAASSAAKWPISYAAYLLATAYHETAGTMQPIKERGGNLYFTLMYDIRGARPKKAREIGNLSPGDGEKYPGRGYVQLTGKANYLKATRLLQSMGHNVDLVANPELAQRPEFAAIIAIHGMQNGWFTGRKLSDDLPSKGQATFRQFVMSRDVINGRDVQEKIANEAVAFQRALLDGVWAWS